MSDHELDTDQIFRAHEILRDMRNRGAPEGLVRQALSIVPRDPGLYDLLGLWAEGGDADRDEIVADIQEALDDWLPTEAERPRIPFGELERIAGDIMAFKRRLRDVIDRNGGVTRVAERTGIPQPSLSRMLNTASMPRRTTLLRIAKALDLPETDIATEWTR